MVKIFHFLKKEDQLSKKIVDFSHFKKKRITFRSFKKI